MKKILFLILVLINVAAYSQNIRITKQLRQQRVGGIYRLQLDTTGSEDYGSLTTEKYVQDYVTANGGISYSQGAGINITNGVISLNSINGFVSQGANMTITGSGTLADPFVFTSTGTGGSGSNANVGSSFRWAIPNTQNIKTFANGYGFILDSATSNTLTGTIDTNLISTKWYRQKGIDSVTNLLSNYATTSSLSNYVPITTLVSTGYGLLGGGQLNANRTHFVDTSLVSTKLNVQNVVNAASVGRSPTYVVAASNAPATIKARADYICDGTADESEINTALALGNVQLTQGTFYISTTGIQMASNRSLVGQGDATILLAVSYATTSKMITATGNQGIILKNFQIDGATHTMGYGVYFELVGSGLGDAAVTGCYIDGLYIKNAYQSAIELQSCRSSIITNTRITSPNWDGIVLKKKTGQSKGCLYITISNTVQNNATAAVWGQFAEYCDIVNNIFEGDSTNSRGQELIQLEQSCTYINIVGNTFKNSAENNININDVCSNIVIDGNIIDKTYTAEGIYCLASNSVISNNIISNSATHGIYFEGSNVTVSGNRVFANSYITNNTYNGISSAFSSDCNVFGNTISKGTNTNKQKYGIALTGATRPLVFGNNLYDAGVTGDYNTNSTTSRSRSNVALDGTWSDLLYTNAQYELNTNKLLGRSTASQGKAEEIAIGSGLSLSGGTLSATAAAPTLVVALTDGATIDTDASQGTTVGATYRVTLGGNRTIANPTNLVDGQRIIYEIKQDGTGSRTVTWGSKFTWSDDIPIPTLSTSANYIDFVSFVYNSSADKLYVTGTNIGVH